MRKLIVSTFASLDGIMQAPGGPEEEPTGGFTLGGWSFDYWDDSMDTSTSGFDGKDRELVLGRRTYQIFEAYWPYQPDDRVAVPLFVVGHVFLLAGLFSSKSWLVAALGCEGPRDFVRRLYAEQFCNFWRFLFSGKWYASLRSRNDA